MERLVLPSESLGTFGRKLCAAAAAAWPQVLFVSLHLYMGPFYEVRGWKDRTSYSSGTYVGALSPQRQWWGCTWMLVSWCSLDPGQDQAHRRTQGPRTPQPSLRACGPQLAMEYLCCAFWICTTCRVPVTGWRGWSLAVDWTSITQRVLLPTLMTADWPDSWCFPSRQEIRAKNHPTDGLPCPTQRWPRRAVGCSAGHTLLSHIWHNIHSRIRRLKNGLTEWEEIVRHLSSEWKYLKLWFLERRVSRPNT